MKRENTIPSLEETTSPSQGLLSPQEQLHYGMKLAHLLEMSNAHQDTISLQEQETEEQSIAHPLETLDEPETQSVKPEIILRYSKGATSFGIVGGLILLMVGIANIIAAFEAGWGLAVVGVPIALLGLGVACQYGTKFTDDSPKLIFDPEGLTYNPNPQSTIKIKWPEIQSAHFTSLQENAIETAATVHIKTTQQPREINVDVQGLEQPSVVIFEMIKQLARLE